MKEHDQIKALAELDGYDWNTRQPMVDGSWMERGKGGYFWCDEYYLISYDAIIPLIQKQSDDVKEIMRRELVKLKRIVFCAFDYCPSQLCEALLRATRKWED